MRVVEITEPGGPHVLHVVEAPEPQPGPGQVQIEVAGAGVNRADLMQRAGLYPPPPGAPPWPGLEVSGVVTRVGAPGPAASVAGTAPQWSVGDEVCALLAGGGYAERVVVGAELVLPVPRGVDLVDAAGLPEAVATIASNLVAAHLAEGENVLIRGGSGGVGSIGVQLVHALGHRVLSTAGGPARVRRVRDLGADVVLDHRSDDLVAQVRRATDGHGVDVLLDVLGAGGLADNLAMLADDGRLVVLGLQQGARGTLDLGLLLARRASVLATALRSRPAHQKAAIMTDVRERLWPMVADGRIRPVVHARLPLAQAGAAHTLLDSGEVFGKLVLVP
ncbi:MAG: NAD(P)H-quinone oxidoreductase [Actinobacteria bacterium]|nr:NAD(P)H-quinone oxidoreductase [Actinomycetota bacterium]